MFHDNEINRCVVEQWIDNKDDDFYGGVATTLRSILNNRKDLIEQMSVLKPYSFVLEDDDREAIEELYLVDDDIVILNDELMSDLDKDLDDFLDKLERIKAGCKNKAPMSLGPMITIRVGLLPYSFPWNIRS